MKHTGYSEILFTGLLVGLLYGCVASAPIYPGDMSAVPVNLKPVEKETGKGRIKMGLPEGWKPFDKVPTYASNWAAEIADGYEKKVTGGSAILIIGCYTGLLGKNDLAEILRSALDPKAVKVMGPYSVDGPSMLDPEFEAYDFDAIRKGLKIPLTALIAWKLDSGMGGCKYGLQMIGVRSARQEMLNDLLAMLKTLG